MIELDWLHGILLVIVWYQAFRLMLKKEMV